MYLAHMNYLEVKEYLQHHDSIVIPVGSLENHGLHLPLGTDFLIPDKIAHGSLQRFIPAKRVFVNVDLPTDAAAVAAIALDAGKFIEIIRSKVFHKKSPLYYMQMAI